MLNHTTTASFRFLTPFVLALCLPPGNAWSTPTAAQPLPTPEQLVAKVLAGKAALKSFDISLEGVVHTDPRARWNLAGTNCSTHRLRWRADTTCAMVEDEQCDPDGGTLKTQILISPEKSMRLEQRAALAAPQGVIQRESLLDSAPGDVRRVWGQLGADYLTTQVTNANSKVRRCSSGFMLRTRLTDASVGTVTIDAEHGFVPVRWEMRSRRGDLVAWGSASNLRPATPGLWLPRQYAYGDASVKADYTITKMTVNADISFDELNFSFPPGTKVDDRISAHVYEVESGASAAPPPEATPPAAPPTTRPKMKPLPKAGEMAPDFTFKTLDGVEMKLGDFKGKCVVLDFWATWCPGCRMEMKELKQIYDDHAHDDRLKMVSLSVDTAPDNPRQYTQANGLNWIQGFLGRGPPNWAVTTLYDVQLIPSVWLIGKDGKIVMQKGLWPSEFRAALERALAG